MALEVTEQLWVFFLEFLAHKLKKVHQLGCVIVINLPPVLAVKQVNHAPEDLCLALDVYQEHGSEVVHALDVADLVVIAGIGLKYIE